ncbi:endolytic transglycosylase MltG [bacterium]|nr:endolytic transglycosylase MltG [bacterium]NCQ55732.1 endolytic transglycosylase MltG [Candidatus Parcubacteria bacterium]NCS67681.1 endolytic transglycosylase MltG [Candidatus Peregrinibacteria bacterium]NCS96695.1 endolytic transglycosylase MltG [bacterium]
MKKYIFLIIVIMGLYFTSRVLYFWDRPNSEENNRVSFTITPGSSFKSIKNLLIENELIADPFSFEVYTRYHKLRSKLQAGDYVVQKNLTFAELVEVLQSGKSQEIRITIPEGSTIAQIDEILARKSLIEPGDFVVCANTCDLGFEIEALEGYLFPSTYYESVQNFSSKKFIQRLYNTFQQQIASLRDDIAASGRSLNETVIVASMIEREAFGSNMVEKQEIADVIWKRLDEGIALGIDATTRYELNNWTTPLYAADLEKNTPYNTRRKLGLPPTAISNPGLDSLTAAANPIETEFYYYLHDSSGNIRFATDLAGHNQNKRDYLY